MKKLYESILDDESNLMKSTGDLMLVKKFFNEYSYEKDLDKLSNITISYDPKGNVLLSKAAPDKNNNFNNGNDNTDIIFENINDDTKIPKFKMNENISCSFFDCDFTKLPKFCNKCTNLYFLRCKKFTGEGLPKKLQQIIAKWCHDLTIENLSKSLNYIYLSGHGSIESIENFKGLKYLNAYDSSITKINNLPSLNNLHLYDCEKFTDLGNFPENKANTFGITLNNVGITTLDLPFPSQCFDYLKITECKKLNKFGKMPETLIVTGKPMHYRSDETLFEKLPNITSLEGFPNTVTVNGGTGKLIFRNCGLETLNGTCKKINAAVSFAGCKKLTGWEGCPEITGKITKGPNQGDTPTFTESPIGQAIKNETKENCKTFYDCIKNHISTFTAKCRRGPSHYPDIVKLSKYIKKTYKVEPLLTKTGKKGAPALLSDIVNSLAAQIEVNWNDSPKARVEKIQKEINKLLNDCMEKSEDAYIGIVLDTNPLVYRYTDSKNAYYKKGVSMAIEVYYEEGSLTYNIDESCILFQK